MFFILSKTLYYLVHPVTWIALLLLSTLRIKKSSVKRKLLTITIILFFLFTNRFLSNELLKAWELQAVPYQEINQDYDLGIVLTGVLQNERTPADRIYFQKGADRLFHTYQLYKKGIIKKILISGGVGRLVEVDYNEADNMKRGFLLLGVPQEDILTERFSRNTAESAQQVANMIPSNTSFLLITSAFHMRRARGCFQRQQLEFSIFPVDFYTEQHYTLDHYIIPSVEGLMTWTRLLNEVTGYIAYDIIGYI